MPSVTLPFVGSFTNPIVPRLYPAGSATEDVYQRGQIFNNCVFSVSVNEQTQTKTVSVEKRPGLVSIATVNATDKSITLLFTPSFNNSTFFAMYPDPTSTAENVLKRVFCRVSATNSFATSGDRDIGMFTGNANSMSESIYGGVGYMALVSTDGTGWYYPMDAGTGDPTFTADTTSGDATLTNVSSFTGLYVGQALSGTGIPAGARIQSLDSGAGTLEMGSDSATATNATANGTGVTITRTPIAKIIDVDFPSAKGKFVFVDGYAFVMTESGRVYQSALNSITSWGASDYITANLSTDAGITLETYKNNILAFGTSACEAFYNAGNPSGSVLSKAEQNFFNIGAYNDGSVVNANDKVYWIGRSGDSAAAVYELVNYSPVKISNQEIDSLLITISGYVTSTNSIKLNVSSVAGSINLFLGIGLTGIWSNSTLGATKATAILYDTATRIWHSWGAANDETAFDAVSYLPYDESILCGGQSNSKIYSIEFSGSVVFKDGATNANVGGDAYDMTVITRKLNLGTNNRKFINRMQLNCDRHSSGSVAVVYLDDDSQDISTATFTSAGSLDISKSNPQIYRLGSHTGGRIWGFIHSEPEDFRMESVTIEHDVGVH